MQALQFKARKVKGLHLAEKDQVNTLVGVIYILAIAVAVGSLFLFGLKLGGDKVIGSTTNLFDTLDPSDDVTLPE